MNDMDQLLERITRGEVVTHQELLGLVHSFIELRADKIMVDRWVMELNAELEELRG